MARKFLVEWPDFKTSLECLLLDDENPKLCDAFWNGLPFETILAASMSAGEMFKVPVPMKLPISPQDTRVFFPEQLPGTFLALGLGSTLLKYGEVAEPFRLPRFARVLEKDLPHFQFVVPKLREAYFFTKVVNKATFTKLN
jgi:hypothetical protein